MFCAGREPSEVMLTAVSEVKPEIFIYPPIIAYCYKVSVKVRSHNDRIGASSVNPTVNTLLSVRLSPCYKLTACAGLDRIRRQRVNPRPSL